MTLGKAFGQGYITTEITMGQWASSGETMKEIVSILQADIADGVICGGAVLAAKDGDVYCDCGEGFTSPERKYPMNTNTVPDVASTTKVAAVVTSLLICHHRGLIDFDAPFTVCSAGYFDGIHASAGSRSPFSGFARRRVRHRTTIRSRHIPPRDSIHQ